MQAIYVATDMHLEGNPATLQDAIKAFRLLVEQSSTTKLMIFYLRKYGCIH